MKTKIIVIHSSEIMAKGIVTMIKQSCTLDTIIVNLLETDNYTNINKHNLLCFVEKNNPIAQKLIQEWDKSNKIKKIQIAQVAENSLDSIDEINPLTNSEHFSQIITTFIENSPCENELLITNDLSQREKEILELVALGNTNKSISKKLFISIYTVMTHRKNITEKLGIKSIPGLTVYALINKIIDIEQLESNPL